MSKGATRVGQDGIPVAQRSATLATRWLEGGDRVAVATLCAVEGSTPFSAGAMLFVRADGRPEGSITGGCIEAEVVDAALEVLKSEPRHPRLLPFGISDSLAGGAGLMCGGSVEVLIDVLRPGSALADFVAARGAGRPASVVIGLDRPVLGRTPREVAADTVCPTPELAPMPGKVDLAVDPKGRRWQRIVDPAVAQMIIVGAVDFAAALAPLASTLGFEVTVADPRQAFAASTRFSDAATVDARWPDAVLGELELGPRDAVLVFTHDPKLDVPAVVAALRCGAGYVGALGSRRATRDRARRLREAGVGEAEVRRIHAPAGLDIGSKTPEETAVAIMAEILAVRSRRSAAPLRDTAGAIRVMDA